MDAGQTPETLVVEEREPQPVLSIRRIVELADLSEAQGELARALGLHPAARRGTRGSSIRPLSHLRRDETDLEVGLPVVEASSGEGQVAAGELPGGAALTTWHLGSHDGLGDAYARLDAWLKEHEREADGAAWEVYTWIDPAWSQTRRPGPRLRSGARRWCSRSSDVSLDHDDDAVEPNDRPARQNRRAATATCPWMLTRAARRSSTHLPRNGTRRVRGRRARSADHHCCTPQMPAAAVFHGGLDPAESSPVAGSRAAALTRAKLVGAGVSPCCTTMCPSARSPSCTASGMRLSTYVSTPWQYTRGVDGLLTACRSRRG